MWRQAVAQTIGETGIGLDAEQARAAYEPRGDMGAGDSQARAKFDDCGRDPQVTPDHPDLGRLVQSPEQGRADPRREYLIIDVEPQTVMGNLVACRCPDDSSHQ